MPIYDTFSPFSRAPGLIEGPPFLLPTAYKPTEKQLFSRFGFGQPGDEPVPIGGVLYYINGREEQLRKLAMRMILPPLRERRVVDRLLSAFFQDYKAINFKKAIAALCRFYNLKNPQVEWFEYIDWGKTAGKTYENGQIYLVHPENWKKGRKYNTERRWINMVYHEIGHYVFWADAENKADMFASRMVRGLNHHKN
jgi:hypothetical protein